MRSTSRPGRHGRVVGGAAPPPRPGPPSRSGPPPRPGAPGSTTPPRPRAGAGGGGPAADTPRVSRRALLTLALGGVLVIGILVSAVVIASTRSPSATVTVTATPAVAQPSVSATPVPSASTDGRPKRDALRSAVGIGCGCRARDSSPRSPWCRDTPTRDTTAASSVSRGSMSIATAATPATTSSVSDLLDPVFKPGTNDCKVLSGLLIDPYDGTHVDFVSGQNTSVLVQIDHVVALAWAWRHGAEYWTDDARAAFANDPLNLAAASEAMNQQKSDSGPSEWLPPVPELRCLYVEDFVDVLDCVRSRHRPGRQGDHAGCARRLLTRVSARSPRCRR